MMVNLIVLWFYIDEVTYGDSCQHDNTAYIALLSNIVIDNGINNIDECKR